MPNPFKPGTIRYMIAYHAIMGLTRREIEVEMQKMLDGGYFLFKRNPTQEEREAGIIERIVAEDQQTPLRNEISRVCAMLEDDAA